MVSLSRLSVRGNAFYQVCLIPSWSDFALWNVDNIRFRIALIIFQVRTHAAEFVSAGLLVLQLVNIGVTSEDFLRQIVAIQEIDGIK